MSHRSRYKLSTLASSRQDDMGMGRLTAEVIRKLARPVNTSAFVGSNPPIRRHYFRFARYTTRILAQTWLPGFSQARIEGG